MKLNDWKDMNDLIPNILRRIYIMKKTGLTGIFAASLELTKRRINFYNSK